MLVPSLGGVLIVASIVLGDTDTDVDLDVDADVDLDVGLDGDQDALIVLKDPGDAVADAGIWLPFFSLRFWTFALAGFGASGLLLHLLGCPASWRRGPRSASVVSWVRARPGFFASFS